MSFTTNPYCVLADVKTALNITNTANDAWLNALIPQAQAYLDREIGYPFQQDGTSQVPATRYYSGTGMEQLLIDDCLQVTQVIETNYNLIMGSNGMWVQGNPSTLDITADVVLGPDNYPNARDSAYLLYRLSGLPFMTGRRNYQVNGVFGRATIPYEITRACIRLTCHYYKMRDTNYADYIDSVQGAVRQKYNKLCPPDVVEIINAYRRKVFFVS